MMRVEYVNEQALILRVDGQTDAIQQVHFYLALVQEHLADEIVDVHPAFESLLIEFDIRKTSLNAMARRIKALVTENDLSQAQYEKPKSVVHVPVCYDEEFAIDHELVSDLLHMDFSECVRLHMASEFSVDVLGFAPGFAYLSGLPQALHLPRKATPALSVPAGSLAIATHYSAIYPMSSPGGWYIIGRTPIHVFNQQDPRRSLFQIAQTVRFQSVDRKTYNAMRDEASACS